MKKLVFATAMLLIAAVFGEITSAIVTGARNDVRLPFCGRVVSVSLAVTNSAAVRVGVVSEFAFGANKVAATNVLFNGTLPSGVTNAVLSTPLYFKQGDRWLCDGAGATNGVAKAEVFMER